MTPNHLSSQRILLFKKEVVGYLDEAKSIKLKLTSGPKQLRVVTIVGMPGQGKTTLAAKVYNDPSVVCHFSIRAHMAMSKIFDKRRVLLDLLGQIDPKKCSRTTSDQDLVQNLWRSLKGRSYLIFLDDGWDVEAWSSLKEAFPEDHAASRIITTSCKQYLAPNEDLHVLRPLNEEESLDLLQRQLLGGIGWPWIT
ncbi:OLC1v1007824C1 [Oldenlandia corymbosa var. corymbosa]|uniref:OLC1v1007824C1 n=1 Tax=Oldenlandia corymbosa var. corymbosa TaxID=529605 RepID=A0AAV1DMJ8_OLDCO|nr:OLC1v1007824C1 [Oldenlandia corymbosa var. corymbosa]